MKRAVTLRVWRCAQAFLCGTLLWAAFCGAAQMARIYPAVGLRYAQPLTREQIQAARAYAADTKNAQGLSASFWVQQPGTACANSTQRACAVIAFSGEGSDCFPAEFITGGYPGASDANGCALSEQLAWELFGSNDLVGQSLILREPDSANGSAGSVFFGGADGAQSSGQGKIQNGEKTYTIRGVFYGDAAVLLTGADETAPFTCAEIAGTTPADRRAQALQFAAAGTLGTPAQLVYGPSAAALLQALCWLPLCLAGAFSLRALWHKSKKLGTAQRQVLWFSVALCFAAALPLFFSHIPAWLIPARWSDFTFWTALWDTLQARVREYFALIPTQKDIAAKVLLVRFAAVLLLCTVLTLRLGQNTLSQGSRARQLRRCRSTR
ncbi:MAG: hypothetical protein RSD62_07515 [Ruthenibacterium sp.]